MRVLAPQPDSEEPRSKSLIGLRVAGASERGPVHKVNEDHHGWTQTPQGGRVLVMCDGMGGMGKGDEASRLAFESICAAVSAPDFTPNQLQQAVMRADQLIRERLCAGRDQPGSTVAATYVADGRAYVAWVGDSRVYHFRGDTLVQRTRDHRVVTEMVEKGTLTEEEARRSAMAHLLSRSLGGRSHEEPPVEVEVLQPQKVRSGDRMVLCSDGLHDHVSESTMIRVMNAKDVESASRELVELARGRGARDDVSCLVAEAREWEPEVETLGDRWDPDLYPTNIMVAGSVDLSPPPGTAPSAPEPNRSLVPFAIGAGLVFALGVAIALLLAFG